MRAGYGGRSWKSPCEAGVTVRSQVRPTGADVTRNRPGFSHFPARERLISRRPARLPAAEAVDGSDAARPADGAAARLRPDGWPPPGAPRERVPGRGRLRGNGLVRLPRRSGPAPTGRSDGRRRGRWRRPPRPVRTARTVSSVPRPTG